MNTQKYNAWDEIRKSNQTWSAYFWMGRKIFLKTVKPTKGTTWKCWRAATVSMPNMKLLIPKIKNQCRQTSSVMHWMGWSWGKARLRTHQLLAACYMDLRHGTAIDHVLSSICWEKHWDMYIYICIYPSIYQCINHHQSICLSVYQSNLCNLSNLHLLIDLIYIIYPIYLIYLVIHRSI